MAKQKYPKITVVNWGGAHGNFLRYTIDRFATHTPRIDKSPFTDLGTAHRDINYSGQVDLNHWDDVHDPFPFINENVIVIDVRDQVLYFERACLNRAADFNTDLFDENSIAETLTKMGSTFPVECKQKRISLKEGFTIGYSNLKTHGITVRNNQRIEKAKQKKNKILFFALENFFQESTYVDSIKDIGHFFDIQFDLTGIETLWQQFASKNKILQTHGDVQKYLDGNKDVKLDIIQQAYVDALEN